MKADGDMSQKELCSLAIDECADPNRLHHLVGLFPDSDRIIAAHPATLPKTLLKLSKSPDAETIKAVLQNPATPPDLLLLMAPKFPLDFFQNPALDLLILEDPDFLRKLKPGVLRSLLKEKDCPDYWLNWACSYGNKGDQLVILKREDLPVKNLKALANSSHPKPAERAMNLLLALGETW